MAFDSTSTLLATGGADATVKVWDVVRQYCTNNLRQHHGVVRLQFLFNLYLNVDMWGPVNFAVFEHRQQVTVNHIVDTYRVNKMWWQIAVT